MNGNFRFLSLETKNFFDFCKKEKHIILLSDWFFKEVQKIIFLNRKDVLEEFKRMKVNVFVIEKKPNKKLIYKIIKEFNLHYSDSIHVAVAYENKSDFIVTWNKKDFEKANEFVECIYPKEFLYIL